MLYLSASSSFQYKLYCLFGDCTTHRAYYIIHDMRRQINLLDESIRPEKIIWYLAWPTVLEQLLITAVQYVDTAMVGSLGANATAAVGLNASTTWLINGICAALGIGFSVLVGRSIGSGDHDKAKRVVRQAVLAIAVFGAALTALVQIAAPFLPRFLGAEPDIWSDARAYLSIVGAAYMFNVSVNVSANIIRCSGDTRTPLFCNIFANVINVVLNFLLIYPTRNIDIFIQPSFMAEPLINTSFSMWGAGLGVRGAAIATAISIAVSGVILFAALFKKDYPAKISIRDKFHFQKDVWKETLRLAYPVALERITLSTGQILMTRIVTGIGTTAIAAHHLAITAESITYMPAFGFSAAATTLVSQGLGASKPELSKRLSKYCVIGGVIFMTLMGFVLYFFSRQLITIFTPDAEVIELGGRVLQIEALAQPCFALAMVISGVLRGAGDTKWPFYISVVGMWGIRLGIAYILAYPCGLGLLGAWCGMVADVVVRGVLSLIRYARGKWVHSWRSLHGVVNETE